MNLVVTSYRNLARIYGRAGRVQVAEAIADVLAARAERGIVSRSYALEDGLPDLGVPGAQPEPSALVEQLRQVDQGLRARGERLESLLIVGGPQVVPFGLAANPMPDQDGPLPTDWIYGLAGDKTHLARWPVGRLPDARETTPATLLRLLASAAAQHRKEAAQTARSFGYSTASWYRSSQDVYAVIGGSDSLAVSPPALAETLDRRLFDAANVVYCNLHGVQSWPYWYGQAVEDPALVVALRPIDLNELDFSGTIVFSQACYGALIDGADRYSSLALTFLAQGATAFISATALSYGAPQPPLGESDLLAQQFLQALAVQDTSVGTALQAARAGMLREVMRRQGFLDEDDVKTLLAFVLYGDPTGRIPSVSRREE